jgi:hypothetical protein
MMQRAIDGKLERRVHHMERQKIHPNARETVAFRIPTEQKLLNTYFGRRINSL